MWPFKCKEEEAPAYKPMPNPFEAVFEVGDEFMFMGIRMRVCGLWGAAGWVCVPQLKANYIDKHGEIRNISFGTNELRGILKENPDLKAEITHI